MLDGFHVEISPCVCVCVCSLSLFSFYTLRIASFINIMSVVVIVYIWKKANESDRWERGAEQNSNSNNNKTLLSKSLINTPTHSSTTYTPQTTPIKDQHCIGFALTQLPIMMNKMRESERGGEGEKKRYAFLFASRFFFFSGANGSGAALWLMHSILLIFISLHSRWIFRV